MYFSPLLPEAWRPFGAGGYAGLTLLAFLSLPRRGKTALGALAVFGILVFLFMRIPGSNDRDWQPEVTQTPYATINGDMVTIHNARNFGYRTETDFEVRWEQRTFCTTSVLFHTRMNPESPPMSWKVLLSGYVPNYLYEQLPAPFRS